MRGFADQLAAVGKNISDDDLICHILAGFGSEFDAVVVNLMHRSDSLNLQEVQYMLQAHEIRMQQQSSIAYSSANMVYNSGGGRFSNYRGRGRGGRFGGRDNKMICQLCGRVGHVALKCFKRFDVHFTGATPTSPQAYLSDVNGMENDQEEYYYEQPYESTWYVDSGATNHITNDLTNMTVSSPYNGPELVAVGNGQQLPIKSVGTTSFPSNSHSLLLNNILYVPAITKTLLSISQFTKDNKIYIEFHHDICLVKDIQTHKTLMKGALRRGLYQLDSSSLIPHGSGAFLVHSLPTATNSSSSLHSTHDISAFPKCTVSANSCNSDISNNTSIQLCDSINNVNLWHNKLGHPNFVVFSKLYKTITGKSCSTSLDFCDACKTTQAFQLVHADLWGPAIHASLKVSNTTSAL